MKPLILIALTLTAIAIIGALASAKKKSGSKEKPRAKHPLTANEQKMFNRLTETLPDMIVMPQVAFSTLLNARTQATRNRFNRKVADFVICDRSFTVKAIVELDDASHRGNEAKDAQRDELLTAAGYRVIRYPRIPNIDKVKDDFKANDHHTNPMVEPSRSAERKNHSPQRDQMPETMREPSARRA
ncbi:MAG: DUF2726 domain-containing protein [Pseudomonas sp.]